MSALRQLLGGLFAAAIVVALVAGGLALSTGDAAIALLPASPQAIDTPTPGVTPSPPSPTPTLAPTDTLTFVPTGICPRPNGWIDYIVQPGDDLASIAAQFNINPTILQVNNCLLEASVSPGQVLFVPVATPTPTFALPATFTPPPPCGPPLTWTRYFVRPGDTLSSLARATGTTVQAIMFANCLESEIIRVGQVLFLPRLPIPTPSRTPSPTPTDTPTLTPTDTPTPTPPTIPIDTPTDTPTATPTPSETPVIIQTPTPTPTIEVTPTDTLPPPSDTPSPTPI